tara:strand:- start:995 stop:2647 length:1653 start_codon:yes stop_codon:yes gene_type:complete
MATNKHIIDVQTKGADKSEKKIKGVSGALGGLAKQAGAAAAAYFGTRALLDGIKQSINLFAEQELAEVKLRKSLGSSINTLQKYASSLQQVTNFGDELIMQGMAQLAFFIKDEKQLKIATKATLDLAAAKGMDLVQAADLVAKSVGSSTNALSRYGIAAEGAVGSEERLLSITDEISNLFGGQAEATTESLSGKIDQMKNAFGDLQEVMGAKLAPIVQSMVVGFTDLISVNLSDELKKERFEFEKLTDVLIDADTSQSSRNKAISELQSKYSDYIGNINLEKTTTEELVKMQKKSIDKMLERIELQVREEKITELMRERFELEDELFTLEANKTKGHFKNLGGMSRVWVEGSEKKIASKNKEIEQVEKEIERITDLSKVQKDNNKEIVNSNNNVTDGLKEQGSWRRKLSAISKQQTLEQGRTEYQTAISGAKAHLLAQIMKTPFPLNLLLAAGVESQVDKLFAKNNVKAFATGADYVTSGPEMIMVGDNPSGQERVQVTPLGGDPNVNGPQGANIVLNISGNVMSEQYTEDVIIPQIKEGLRLGGDIGIN